MGRPPLAGPFPAALHWNSQFLVSRLKMISFSGNSGTDGTLPFLILNDLLDI